MIAASGFAAPAAAVCGRRVCAWCKPARDLGPAPELAAGAITHGICPQCAAQFSDAALATAAAAAAVVRPHPCGGYTHARRVPGTGTARIYVGHWSTRRAAAAAL